MRLDVRLRPIADMSEARHSSAMGRRVNLVWCAGGAALVDVSLVIAIMLDGPLFPENTRYRYELETGRPPYAVTIARLVECGATEFWLEHERTHVPPRWVLEASKTNAAVLHCFNGRTISPDGP